MPTRDELIESLKEKKYRDAFVSSQINIGIPYQIRALRGKRSQGDLPILSGMKQPRISAIERPGNGSLNLNTLKRVAAALDVALMVRFVPFSELVEWAETFSPDSFAVPDFGSDEALFRGSASAAISPKPVNEQKSLPKQAASSGMPSGAANKPATRSALSALTQPGGVTEPALAHYVVPRGQLLEARV